MFDYAIMLSLMVIARRARCLFVLFALSALGTVTGCKMLIGGLTSSLAEDLAASILNSPDVDTVREGIPAYIIMLDSFLRRSPEDTTLLLTAAELNGAFSTFTEGDRAKVLTSRARDFALRAACAENDAFCSLPDMPFDAYEAVLVDTDEKDIALLYEVGVAWTGWLEANSDDWNAIAQLGRVRALMTRVIELDETHDDGGGHLYLGGLETVLPAAMGGNPEKGRGHFEAALSYSGDTFLMTKVIFAQQYARLVFDQELHDRLLNEVLAADPVVPGNTLINTYAQRQAALLLAESVDYF